MCQNIFRNEDEAKRREDFTRLFVRLAENELQMASESKSQRVDAVWQEGKIAAT